MLKIRKLLGFCLDSGGFVFILVYSIHETL